MRTRILLQRVSMTALALALLLRGAAAQNTAVSGSYGFLVNVEPNDVSLADNNGTAILGVLNVDGSGNVTGTYTIESGGAGGSPAENGSGNLTGNYAGNPNGTGTLTLSLDVGAGLTFATVVSDNGQVLQLVSTSGSGMANNLGGGDIPLQGTSQSVTGVLPVGLFLGGASGNLNLSLTGTTSPGGSMTTYTSTGGTGSGPIVCEDGSTQTWNVTATSAAVVIIFSGPGTFLGDYVLGVTYTSCGQSNQDEENQTLSGSVSGGIGPDGGYNLVLHGSGFLVSGIARAGQATSLSGSYAFQDGDSPTPSIAVGVLTFDGAGNATLTNTSVGSPGTSLALPVSSNAFTGTYSINPDGSGMLNLTSATAGTRTFAFVVTNGGSGLLLLRTDAAPGGNVILGSARMQ